ncbi:MAG: hypothetical protein ABL871_09850 [Terricaulis sp.]
MKKLIGALILSAVLASCGQTTATNEQASEAADTAAEAPAAYTDPADTAATTSEEPAAAGEPAPGYTPPQD